MGHLGSPASAADTLSYVDSPHVSYFRIYAPNADQPKWRSGALRQTATLPPFVSQRLSAILGPRPSLKTDSYPL